MIHRAPLDGHTQQHVHDLFWLASCEARRWRTGPVYCQVPGWPVLIGFLQGKETENWIPDIAKHQQDGHWHIIALHWHYAGNKGNSIHRTANTKLIQSSLRYKAKRALPFTSRFLDSLHCMFTLLFEEEGEPLTERAKVVKLLTWVWNTTLATALLSWDILFTIAANHLNSEISQTPDFQLSCKISSVSTGGGSCGCGGWGGLSQKQKHKYWIWLSSRMERVLVLQRNW